ncbi:hypothetical protein AXG93_367s1000 [Marchantia polymorpha subsp. ruderalis]|uniref:Uncharacterized protein n=1 Tax=Marchantia polymorpha subsp. ruderalis TaxID=1480154 RepID=A0A176VVJ6_MARPO|nr:hypothetical protein AXG93_367s1000 [Marchantia polymorpha subsp. ruderalis]
MPKTRARPKKKAQRQEIVLESSEGSVAMFEGTASSADEEKEYLRTLECGPLGLHSEKPLGGGSSTFGGEDGDIKSRSSKKADMPEPKTIEEHAKKLTLNKKILEQVVEQMSGTVVESLEISSPQVSSRMAKPEVEKKSLAEEPKEVVVAFPNFLQYSVVPLLNYLDGKREKYAVSAEARFYVEMFRNSTRSVRAASLKTAKEMERECASVTASLKTKKHKAELASWWKKLTECKTAKSSEIECKLKLDVDCDRLRDQLKTVEKQLEMLRIREEAAKLAF